MTGHRPATLDKMRRLNRLGPPDRKVSSPVRVGPTHSPPSSSAGHHLSPEREHHMYGNDDTSSGLASWETYLDEHTGGER